MLFSRRQFSAQLAAGLSIAGLSITGLAITGLATAVSPLCAADPTDKAADTTADKPAQQPLRVLTYNIYAGKGWPSERAQATQAFAAGHMPRRLARELALYRADIINFSESPSQEFTEEVAQHLGMHHVRFPSGGNWPGTLLSRFEISESQNVPLASQRPQELFTRHWGRATLKLPTGDPLIVHSAHLFPVEDPSVRLQEISAMLTSMKADLDAHRSMLLIGDLNHTPDSQEYQRWLDAGWIDTFTRAGEGDGLTFRSDTPEKRIDYIMAAGPIAQQSVSCRPLFEGDFRLPTDDQESFALSDHLPVFAIFDLKKN